MTPIQSKTLTELYYRRELEKKQAGKPYDPLLNTLGMEALGLEAEPEAPVEEALPIIVHSQPVKAPETENTAEVLREIHVKTPNHAPKQHVFLKILGIMLLGMGLTIKMLLKATWRALVVLTHPKQHSGMRIAMSAVLLVGMTFGILKVKQLHRHHQNRQRIAKIMLAKNQD